jgi:hypothetical protein
MSHKQRHERWAEIVSLYQEGISVADIADYFQLHPDHIRFVLRQHRIAQGGGQEHRQYTPEEQEQNCRQAEIAFSEWKTAHLHTCKDYPAGACCHNCHAMGILFAIELPDGDVAYVCCTKADANNLAP